MDEQLARRLDKIEDSHGKMNETCQKLAISIERLQVIINQLNNLDPRVRALETKIDNNTMVINAVKWLAISVGGVLVIYFFNMITKGN